MPRSLVAVYLHLIWGTWDRQPLLEPGIERAVHRAIEAKARELGAEVLAVGGVEDHVHLLVGVPARLCVADLMQGVKGASAHLITHELIPGGFFKWQRSYGAFSVSPRNLDEVRDYITRQREHHAVNHPTVHWERRIFDMIRAAHLKTTDGR